VKLRFNEPRTSLLSDERRGDTYSPEFVHNASTVIGLLLRAYPGVCQQAARCFPDLLIGTQTIGGHPYIAGHSNRFADGGNHSGTLNVPEPKVEKRQRLSQPDESIPRQLGNDPSR
jgi:hypothetical protein